MLTSRDVVSAYKLILGREPESSVIIQNFVEHSDFDHLRRTLLGSGEFAERLGRDASLLAVPMATLTMTEEVRRYKARFEALVALALPIWDESVLIVGEEPSNLADFFLDRACKVSIAVSADTARLIQKSLAGRHPHGANTSILPPDTFRVADTETLGRYDLVYTQLPDDDSDVMRTWLDDAAEACTGTMILTCELAPGRSEDVFVTPNPRDTARLRTVPTKKWVFARLRERFGHVYEPVGGPPEGTAALQATCVASCVELNSPALTEYLVRATRPLPSFAVRA